MVDEFMTDQEQAELVKSWWRENGLYVVAGLVIGVGSLFGYRGWQEAQETVRQEASSAYTELTEAISRSQIEKAEEVLDILDADYAGTPYPDQSRLALAKAYMSRNDSASAAAALESVVNSGGDPQIRSVARQRLARVYLHEERYDDAMSLLADTDAGAFSAAMYELRGDIEYARENYLEAWKEYEQALAQDESGVINRPLVEAKRDELAAWAPGASDAEIDVIEQPPVDGEVAEADSTGDSAS